MDAEEEVRTSLRAMENEIGALNESFGLVRALLQRASRSENEAFRQLEKYEQYLVSIGESDDEPRFPTNPMKLARAQARKRWAESSVQSYALRHLYGLIMDAKRSLLRGWDERLRGRLLELPVERQSELRTAVANLMDSLTISGVEAAEAGHLRSLDALEEQRIATNHPTPHALSPAELEEGLARAVREQQ